MNQTEYIYSHFQPLWADARDENSFPDKRPLLAHYTSMATLECIMKNDEIWLSNPLCMNDVEELRFGLFEAANAFRSHAGIKEVCGGDGVRYNAINDAFDQQLGRLSNDDAFDTYCVCFCEHNPQNDDGLLSMWRGYGGNGSGAAIVFDTGKLPSIESSPLILSRVHYATREQRLQWIKEKLDQFAIIFKSVDIPIEMLHVPVHSLLSRFNIFALFTKHDGFIEEAEWRMVYVKDKDREGMLANMFHYHVCDNRIEPKLKFKIGPINKVTGDSLRLQDFIDRIILGPSASAPISIASVQRMLNILDKKELSAKVKGASTPYRARP